MGPVANAPRRYRGITAEERQSKRHEQVLEAGLEIFGTQGYAASSVRLISAAAGLNSRYFYESFASKEDLLITVYDRIMMEVALAVRDATAQESTLEGQARAGLRAGWIVLTGDRRKARVVALEVVGVSEPLERMRRERRHAFADLIVQNALALARGRVSSDVPLMLDPVVASRALMGGIIEVLVDWINGDIEISPDEYAEQFARMFTAVGYAAINRTVPGSVPLELAEGAASNGRAAREAVVAREDSARG
jgi:AcrR family transcriptional regulator